MPGHAFDVDECRLHPLLIDLRAVPVFWEIAFSLRQLLQELRLQRLTTTFLCKLHGASRVVQHLRGLDSRKFVEEPATTGVHQHGVALHFEQAQSQDLLLLI